MNTFKKFLLTLLTFEMGEGEDQTDGRVVLVFSCLLSVVVKL